MFGPENEARAINLLLNQSVTEVLRSGSENEAKQSHEI